MVTGKIASSTSRAQARIDSSTRSLPPIRSVLGLGMSTMRRSVPGIALICAPWYMRLSRISRDSGRSAGANLIMLPCVATSVSPEARAKMRSRATSNRFLTGVGSGP